MAYCSNCGNKLSENDKFCDTCGELIQNSNYASNKISNTHRVKKFNHSNYIVILIISIIIGIIIHIYFMEGSGKHYLQSLIDKYGSIGYIPLEDALLYDFHYTWLTYTAPQTILICGIWYLHYKNSKSTTNKNESSEIKFKDGAGLR